MAVLFFINCIKCHYAFPKWLDIENKSNSLETHHTLMHKYKQGKWNLVGQSDILKMHVDVCGAS